MIAIALLFIRMLCDYFKPRQRLAAEILVLRHQLNILQQRAPRRSHLRCAIERDPVVPGPIISARELLGEMLLERDRPQQALEAFEADLRNEPGRFWSLYGAAQAAERAGDRERARSFYSDLVAQTVHADGDRLALKAARTFLQAVKG